MATIRQSKSVPAVLFFFFLLLTWLLATLVVPIALSSPSFAFVTLPPLKVLFMLPALPGQPSYEV